MSQQQANYHTVYNPDASSTSSRLANQAWSITYGDGSTAGGFVYTDRVTVGSGASGGAAASFAMQAVEVANTVSASFTNDAYSSGILGLGMGSINTVRPTQQATFMENVRGSLYLPVFTANLRRGATGNYNFGYIDGGEFVDRVGYVDLVGFRAGADDFFRNFWSFRPAAFRVGASPPVAVGGWTVIADTGTTLLLVPGYMVTAYYARVRGARFDPAWGAVVFPCGGTLPSFGFSFASTIGKTYWGSVPGRYLSYAQVNSTHCYGGLQSSDAIGFSIFGAMLLKAQFVVFDLGNKRLGFANKRLLA